MTTSVAYFLVIHGSRNTETLIAANQFQQLLIAQIEAKRKIIQSNLWRHELASLNSTSTNVLDQVETPLIEVAALELAPLPLNLSLTKFAHKAQSLGCNRIKVIPLFFAPGVHVIEDIPAEVSLAVKKVNNIATIELSTFLGKYSGIPQLIIDKFENLSAQTRILVAHGSRLPGVANFYKSLTTKVGALDAYWSTEPSLENQVKLQIDLGSKSIAILPYFLFPGRITNAIANQVHSLQQKYPEVELILGQPLGTSKALAELVAKEI